MICLNRIPLLSFQLELWRSTMDFANENIEPQTLDAWVPGNCMVDGSTMSLLSMTWLSLEAALQVDMHSVRDPHTMITDAIAMTKMRSRT